MDRVLSSLVKIIQPAQPESADLASFGFCTFESDGWPQGSRRGVTGGCRDIGGNFRCLSSIRSSLP